MSPPGMGNDAIDVRPSAGEPFWEKPIRQYVCLKVGLLGVRARTQRRLRTGHDGTIPQVWRRYLSRV